MGKWVQKIHLNETESNVDMYGNIFEMVDKISVGEVKQMFNLYVNLYGKVAGYLKDTYGNKDDIKKEYEEDYSYYWEDNRVENFLSGRMKASFEVKDTFMNLEGKVDEEIRELVEIELITIQSQLAVIISTLDACLMKVDEYWYPKTAYTLYIWDKVFDYGWKKEKERVWQPKTS